MASSFTARLREAAEEGYIQCICGEFTVSVHSECRALMTAAEYERWSEQQNRLYERLFA